MSWACRRAAYLSTSTAFWDLAGFYDGITEQELVRLRI